MVDPGGGPPSFAARRVPFLATATAMRSPLPVPHSRRLPYGVLVGVVATLYFAKEVLIPLALALLFSFLLGPLVRRLERCGLRRVPSVLLVAAAFFCVFGSVAWLTVAQVMDLAAKVPGYQDNIQHKFESLRGHGGTLQKAVQVIETVEKKAADSNHDPANAREPAAPAATDNAPLPVRVIEPPASPPLFLRNFFGPLLGPLGTAGIVMVFTVFMLIQREDLRDRLLHLAGPERLPLTTQAVDEASQRVSRYLQAQVAVNFTLGVLIAAGLFFLHVPNAALWGLLAALLRFIPYVGIWLSAAAPLAVSLASSDSWWPLALTAGLFVVLETLTGNALEPWLYGSSTGLSPAAVIVAATFWTWLWGGVGLLLSTPLTVCIVVLGRYVPQMAFLHTLLGDEPVLAPESRLYQRLLAFDQEEVSQVVDEYLAAHPVVDFYDQVLVPALNQAQKDAQLGNLGEDRQAFVRQTVATLVEELHERPAETLAASPATEAGPAAAPTVPAAGLPVRVLIVPVKTDADELAARMLAHLFELGSVGSEVLPVRALANEALEAIAERGVDLVCLSALRPFAVMQARYLAKRVRARFPHVKILVGLWDSKKPAETARDNLESARPDWIVHTLAEAISQVCPVAHCQPCAALEPTPAKPGEETVAKTSGPASPEAEENSQETQELVETER